LIVKLRNIPQLLELPRILKQEFSNQYSYKILEIGPGKSILIKKSFMVGVQITQKGEEISVQGSFPSIATSIFASIIFGLLHIYLPSVFASSWMNFEHELAVFLNQKYK